MKALTVRQPWAHVLQAGVKDVENRTWSTKYRGGLLIHAGKTVDRDAAGGPLAALLAPYGPAGELPRGVILGAVRLVDVHAHDAERGCHRPADVLGWQPYDGSDAAAPGWTPRLCSPWAMPGQYHWRIRRGTRFAPPVPAKGMLGLWTPRGDVEAAVRERLNASLLRGGT